MRMRLRTRLTLLAAAAIWLTAVASGSGQKTLTPSAMRNHAAIGYGTTPPADAVARLGERLERGDAALTFDPATGGYLRSVLTALGVPLDSQLLVFSKTSFQARKIGPQNPRALYFNDTVAVGFVRGGDILEFVAQDPRQGAMFYTLENAAGPAPRIKRDLSCVQCHTWEATSNVPGMFLGSGFPASDGSLLYAPVYSSDHRTPFQLRWGGWYVTGRHALPRHMGNATAAPGVELYDMVNPQTLNVASLEGKFDMAGYPSPHSDIVALMVLEHQARGLNLITRVGWESRIGADAGRPLSDAVDELVDYLLFVDEAPLPGPVTGASTFARTFPQPGPRDAKGRSLRDFDLEDRLMRYPCSYLIYSAPFEALPADARQAVYARMWKIFSGAATEPRYARLDPGDRQAVIEILADTKKDLPSYFTAAALSTP